MWAWFPRDQRGLAERATILFVFDPFRSDEPTQMFVKRFSK